MVNSISFSRLPCLFLALIALWLTVLPIHAFATTLAVNNFHDDGPGSLRQAINDSNRGDVIDFDNSLNGYTIELTNPIVLDDKELTIQGPGAENLAISGVGDSGLFEIGWAASAKATFTGLTLRDGYQQSGGGALAVSGGGGTVEVNIRDCVITGNTSAIQMAKGSLSIVDSSLSDNQDYTPAGAGGGGGAIFMIQEAHSLTITNSTLNGNSTDDLGGAIRVVDNVSLTITNSTLSNNSASSGGALSSNGMAAVTILNTTVTDNVATDETGVGGLFVTDDSRVWIGNSIVAGNRAPMQDRANIGSFDGGVAASLGHNLFGENVVAGIGGMAVTEGDLILPVGIGTAIGPLADHGGPTLAHLPIAGSLVIDAGDNTLIPVEATTDQRGQPRIQNGIVDIGAIEVSMSEPICSIAMADIDGNGLVSADTDGLLVLRYLFDFRGAALVRGVIDAEHCQRCYRESVLVYLDENRQHFDIDGNGVADALSDGILLMRYLSQREPVAIAQAIDSQHCSRCEDQAVVTYIYSRLVCN